MSRSLLNWDFFAEYDMDIRLMMVRAINNLKLNNHSCLSLVESGVFPALLGILQGDNIHAQVAILRALRHLTEFEQSRVTFAQLGAVVILVNCLKTDHKKLRLVSYTKTHVICKHSEKQTRFEKEDKQQFFIVYLLLVALSCS